MKANIIFPALVCLFLLSVHTVNAQDHISFSRLNLPLEYQVNHTWVRVINSQQEWEQFYSDMRLSSPLPIGLVHEAPEIDFSQYTVVAGGLGAGTGPTLSIDRVINGTDKVYVQALRLGVGPNCATAQVIRYPTLAIQLPKTQEVVTYLLDVVIRNCQ